jgi:ribonuclease Y
MTTSATDYVAEYTTTVFPVAGEAIKGKIIGKEGRNIKTFEKITGVELIMDEADDYIVISCFDPLRRELAKIALTKLVKDGRIHPAKIEEFVQKARIDLAKQIIKDGEEIAFKAGFPGLSVEHLKYLGRMRYRFSYGQNLGTHVLEVVNISGKIAAELGLNIKLAKECALWHDIGKVVSHEKEGDHMELGEEIGRKLGLKEEVINAMYAHHMAKDPICMESAIIYIADANSGARPGARYGKDEDYVKRIKELEDIAKNIEGVKDAYAVDAGREVRVFVDPVRASDDRIIVMSNDIAKEIQETQTYPGTIKVTVIREVRASAMAK